jgi:spermidine/putrescine transport system substrate-binding protein
MTSKTKSNALKTVEAAKEFNRRTVLKGTAAAVGVAVAGPFVIRDAYAAGTVNAIVWTNYLTDDFLKKFEKDTGIKVNVTPMGSNEELLNKMKASSM